jgi:hypothetical protein
MEHSTDNPSVNMIPFPTHTILDGEIIPTYATATHPNKAIKPDSSIPMDFNPNRIIKQDNLLHSQTPMLWGRHPMMINELNFDQSLMKSIKNPRKNL